MAGNSQAFVSDSGKIASCISLVMLADIHT